jgi:hypothetical protein
MARQKRRMDVESAERSGIKHRARQNAAVGDHRQVIGPAFPNARGKRLGAHSLGCDNLQPQFLCAKMHGRRGAFLSSATWLGRLRHHQADLMIGMQCFQCRKRKFGGPKKHDAHSLLHLLGQPAEGALK